MLEEQFSPSGLLNSGTVQEPAQQEPVVQQPVQQAPVAPPVQQKQAPAPPRMYTKEQYDTTRANLLKAGYAQALIDKQPGLQPAQDPSTRVATKATLLAQGFSHTAINKKLNMRDDEVEGFEDLPVAKNEAEKIVDYLLSAGKSIEEIRDYSRTRDLGTEQQMRNRLVKSKEYRNKRYVELVKENTAKLKNIHSKHMDDFKYAAGWLFSSSLEASAEQDYNDVNNMIVAGLYKLGVVANVNKRTGNIETVDKLGNVTDVTPGFLDSLKAAAGETTGSLGGAIIGAVAGTPGGPLGMAIGAYAGGVAGAGVGVNVDYVANAMATKEEIEGNIMWGKMKDSGAADAVYTALGATAFKAVVSSYKGTRQVFAKAYDYLLDGNAKGAKDFLLRSLELDEEQAADIIANYKELNKGEQFHNSTLLGGSKPATTNQEAITILAKTAETGASIFGQVDAAGDEVALSAINRATQIMNKAEDLFTTDDAIALREVINGAQNKVRQKLGKIKETGKVLLDQSKPDVDIHAIVIAPADKHMRWIATDKAELNRFKNDIAAIGEDFPQPLFSNLFDIRDVVEKRLIATKDVHMQKALQASLDSIDSKIEKVVMNHDVIAKETGEIIRRNNISQAEAEIFMKAWRGTLEEKTKMDLAFSSKLIKFLGEESNQVDGQIGKFFVDRAKYFYETRPLLNKILPQEQLLRLENAMAKHIISSHTKTTSGIYKGADFPAMLEQLKDFSFKSPEVQKQMHLIKQMADVYKGDRHLGSFSGKKKLVSKTSTLATSVVGKLKYEIINRFYNSIKLLAPNDTGKQASLIHNLNKVIAAPGSFNQRKLMLKKLTDIKMPQAEVDQYDVLMGQLDLATRESQKILSEGSLQAAKEAEQFALKQERELKEKTVAGIFDTATAKLVPKVYDEPRALALKADIRHDFRQDPDAPTDKEGIQDWVKSWFNTHNGRVAAGIAKAKAVKHKVVKAQTGYASMSKAQQREFAENWADSYSSNRFGEVPIKLEDIDDIVLDYIRPKQGKVPDGVLLNMIKDLTGALHRRLPAATPKSQVSKSLKNTAEYNEKVKTDETGMSLTADTVAKEDEAKVAGAKAGESAHKASHAKKENLAARRKKLLTAKKVLDAKNKNAKKIAAKEAEEAKLAAEKAEADFKAAKAEADANEKAAKKAATEAKKAKKAQAKHVNKRNKKANNPLNIYGDTRNTDVTVDDYNKALDESFVNNTEPASDYTKTNQEIIDSAKDDAPATAEEAKAILDAAVSSPAKPKKAKVEKEVEKDVVEKVVKKTKSGRKEPPPLPKRKAVNDKDIPDIIGGGEAKPERNGLTYAKDADGNLLGTEPKKPNTTLTKNPTEILKEAQKQNKAAVKAAEQAQIDNTVVTKVPKGKKTNPPEKKFASGAPVNIAQVFGKVQTKKLGKGEYFSKKELLDNPNSDEGRYYIENKDYYITVKELNKMFKGGVKLDNPSKSKLKKGGTIKTGNVAQFIAQPSVMKELRAQRIEGLVHEDMVMRFLGDFE